MRADAREPVFTTVYGGHGYAAGELIRLLAGHPTLRLGVVASSSQAGRPVVEAFPHLAGAVDDALRFVGADDVPALLRGRGNAAAFFATPHGATAPLVAEALRRAAKVDCALRCVDLSADFRFPDAEAYRAVYGAPHGAPQLIPEFTCAPPDLRPGRPPAHAVQPGCFTTCVVLAAAPFLAAGMVEPDVFASAITGSSGSGATPAANTHHPERRSNLYAYGPLAHRHEPEMRRLLAEAAGDVPVHVDFVPHSGPFVRGIHATVRMRLVRDVAADEVVRTARAAYAHTPFVGVSATPPKLTEVVGTNRFRLGATVRGRTLVVTAVLDNLVKGAAGGAVQWMNRAFDLPEDAGLRTPGLGWM